MITLAKSGTLADHRKASEFLGQGPVLHKLFKEMGKRYASRPGGYTRLMRDFPRKGDGAPMAIVELVDRVLKPVTTEKKSSKEKLKPAIKAGAVAQASK